MGQLPGVASARVRLRNHRPPRASALLSVERYADADLTVLAESLDGAPGRLAAALDVTGIDAEIPVRFGRRQPPGTPAADTPAADTPAANTPVRCLRIVPYPALVVFSSLQPLRYRNFALIWVAALVSNVGSWMQTVTVGILVTARTGKPGWTGLVAAAAFVPIGLLSPLGGALADRLDRRRWLLATTCGETAFAAALTALAASGHTSPGLVTLLVFGGGAMAAIGFPAYQAMLPDLVPSADLGAAISLSSAQFNLGRVIGPALAGVAIVAGGYPWAFGINAASFAAVVAALLVVRLPAPVPGPVGISLARRLWDGARTTASIPGCRSAVVLISVVALTASPFIALVPAVAAKLFGSGAAGTSVLVTAQGIGAVTGALLITPLGRRFGRLRVLQGDLIAVAVLLAGYALAPNLAVAAVAIALLGAAYIGVLAGLNTTVQMHAPVAQRGRILGIYMMALGLLYPLGAVVQGDIANHVGLRSVTLGAASLLLLAVTVGRRTVRPKPAPGAPSAGGTGVVATASPLGRRTVHPGREVPRCTQ